MRVDHATPCDCAHAEDGLTVGERCRAARQAEFVALSESLPPLTTSALASGEATSEHDWRWAVLNRHWYCGACGARSAPNGKEPPSGGCHGKAREPRYCHPGDDLRQRWIVIFDGADAGPSIFFNETEARRFFAGTAQGWNCHLFESCVRDRETDDYPRPDLSEVRP